MRLFNLDSLVHILLAAGSGCYGLPAEQTQAQCASFAQLNDGSIDGTHLSKSEFVLAGALNILGVVNKLPFCRVTGSVTYAGNESVGIELWLPTQRDYNGRYMAVGTSHVCSLFSQADGILDRICSRV